MSATLAPVRLRSDRQRAGAQRFPGSVFKRYAMAFALGLGKQNSVKVFRLKTDELMIDAQIAQDHFFLTIVAVAVRSVAKIDHADRQIIAVFKGFAAMIRDEVIAVEKYSADDVNYQLTKCHLSIPLDLLNE